MMLLLRLKDLDFWEWEICVLLTDEKLGSFRSLLSRFLTSSSVETMEL